MIYKIRQKVFKIFQFQKTILDIYVEFLYNIFVNKDANQAQKLYSGYKYELIKVTTSCVLLVGVFWAF